MEQTTATPHEHSDRDLVLRAQAGDALAFEELTHRYFGMAHAVAWAALRNVEDSEEIAQEAFLRVYLHLGELRDPSAFRGWLRRVTATLASNHATRERRRSFLAPTITLDEEALRVAEHSLGERIERDEERLRAEAALATLPADQRELILLHYSEGWTVQSISERLQVHPTTVGRRLERAMETLRRRLGANGTDALRRLGPSRSARVRTLALVATVSAMPAVSRAALAGKAVVPTATASAKGSGTVPAIMSFLQHSATTVATGVTTMGKVKLAGLAVGVLLTVGVVVAVQEEPEPNAASTLNAVVGAELTPSFLPGSKPIAVTGDASWLVGSWEGKSKHKGLPGSGVVVIQVQQMPDGKFMGHMYSPEVPLGRTPIVSIKATPDRVGTEIIFDYDSYVYAVTSASSEAVEGTWSEKKMADSLKVVKTAHPSPIKFPPVRTVATVSAEALELYKGTYFRSTTDSVTVTRKNDHLDVIFDHLNPGEFFPESENSFFSPDMDITLRFEPGPDGTSILTTTQQWENPPRQTRYLKRK